MLEFLKLEKIEFGGKLGGSLSQRVAHIFTEFVDIQNKFNNSTYDPVDIDSEVQCIGFYCLRVCLFLLYLLYARMLHE